MPTLAEMYDVGLVDLDGVVYVGAHAMKHAADTLQMARVGGMRLAFITNNASRTPGEVAVHLTDLGIGAADDEVVTSAQAGASLLAQHVSPGAKVLVVGGGGLERAVRDLGFRPVHQLDDGPEAVIQGFHPDVGWRLLAEGSYAVASGLPWIATNTDTTIPTARGTAPGNGMLVAAVKAATGRDPVVAGKPAPAIFREAVRQTNAAAPLVIGDRLDTDIEGANRAEIDSLVVLTGISSPTDIVLAPPRLRPTYVGHDLRALHLEAAALCVAAGQTMCGAWTAHVKDRELLLGATTAPQPSALDAIRAACGAVWAADDIDRSSVQSALVAAER